MYKIGVLLPRSTYYQSIGFDLFEGIRNGLKYIGSDTVKIVTENIGFGADKQQCYRAAEKLLLDEGVDLVVAYVSQKTAQLLRPLFLSTHKMLLVLDAGASLPQEWTSSPNIFYHSLHNALGAWLSAKKAAKEGYKSAGMVTGYYDGGYLQTVGIFNGFQEFGGTIQFNHATGYKPEDFSMTPLQEHLSKNPDSALLSIFSGDFVQWYFKAINDVFGKNNTVPIYLTPFSLEESMLESAVFSSSNVKGIAAWSKQIQSPENLEFLEILNFLGKKVNLFTLLGWESAYIITKILDLIDEKQNDITKIADELKQFQFQGPRGIVTFHAETNTSISSLYEVSVVKSNQNDGCDLCIDAVIANPLDDFVKLMQQPLEGIKSAWYNSYVCI